MTTAATTERVVPFTTGDGRRANLLHVTGTTPPAKGPVLLVHGAGVRANIFRAPVRRTLVDVLVERGWDVWMENWRASIDLEPTRWTLDEAALYDHPKAVDTVVAETGAERIKAVIHCQGSTSFAMAAVAGLVPAVDTIVSNAVSLHPVVPTVSKLKSRFLVPLVAAITPYMDPQWGNHAPDLIAKAFLWLTRLTHHECDNDVCKLASFTYGTGFPTLWEHENLNDATHEWVRQEFAKVPMTFFTQMRRCIDAGHLVGVDGLPGLPNDFVAQPPQTDARFSLFSGEVNRCFLPMSQVKTYAWLDRHRRNHHTLRILPGYGHLDVFMGDRAAEDVFPLMIEELERTT